MSRVNRIRKRDKTVVQTKKLIEQGIKRIAGTTISTGASPTMYSQGGSGGGLTGDENVLTKVYSYNVTGTSPAYVTRQTVKPIGALFGWDDEANEEVQIRFSALADPMLVMDI